MEIGVWASIVQVITFIVLITTIIWKKGGEKMQASDAIKNIQKMCSTRKGELDLIHIKIKDIEKCQTRTDKNVLRTEEKLSAMHEILLHIHKYFLEKGMDNGRSGNSN